MARNPEPPSVQKKSFDCPHCGTFTTQTWFDLSATQRSEQHPLPSINHSEWASRDPDLDYGGRHCELDVERLFISQCFNCTRLAVWKYKSLLWPQVNGKIVPNDDMPEDIKTDFREAALIVSASPRGAAALLRLAIQKLCAHLLGKTKVDINVGIKKLVADHGVPEKVSQALDIVRVIGNAAVHPGKIDISDDTDTAMSLFWLVNTVVDYTISHPKQIGEMYGQLPQSKVDQIADRDKRHESESAP